MLLVFLAETAINIGYSCKLLTDEMEEIYVVDGETYEEVEDQLSKALNEMQQILESGRPQVDLPQDIRFSHGGPQKPGEEPLGGFALVINGHSLVSGLIDDMV